jgi:hypothetical protein
MIKEFEVKASEPKPCDMTLEQFRNLKGCSFEDLNMDPEDFWKLILEDRADKAAHSQ